MQELFKQLGLNDKESQVFLKLLQLGPQPVSVVAKHVGLPRSSTYFIVDKLKSLQMLEEFERSGIKYVRCIPVQQLADVLSDREQDIQKALKLLRQKLPELQAMQSTLNITPTVRFIEGRDAALKMYLSQQTQLNKKWCTIFSPATIKKVAPEILDTTSYTGGEKGGARDIVVDSPEAREYAEKFRKDKRFKVKFLPKKVTFESDLAVCSDSIYMTALKGEQAAGILIAHPQLVKQMQAVFDVLWDVLPDR